jgi:hypothetical protein
LQEPCPKHGFGIHAQRIPTVCVANLSCVITRFAGLVVVEHYSVIEKSLDDYCYHRIVENSAFFFFD